MVQLRPYPTHGLLKWSQNYRKGCSLWSTRLAAVRYATYTPEYGYLPAGLYNPAVAPQYYPTMYATSPTAVGPPPYPYGSYHAYGQTAPGASFTGPQVPHHQLPLSTYLRYPAQPVEGFSSPASWGQPFPFSPSAPAVSRLPVDPSSSDSQNQQQSPATPGVNADNTST